MNKRSLRPLACGLASLLAAGLGWADAADLADLGIDQLMQTEVTSASRKGQKLAETPAAIYVLTNDAIQRSGATTLPELLQMVPGVEGGAINSHTYGIGIRGLNAQWSNKLLVLIDGRSIYTRTFSGVHWDSHNLPFEDIERIEVIRGANAALWGANAVNGVINIITKNSAQTQGTLLRASAGTNANGDALARHGTTLGPHGFGRLYVSGERHGNSAGYPHGEANDDWSSQRVGARGDWEFASGYRLMTQAELFRINSDNDVHPPSDDPVGAEVDPNSSVHGRSLHLALTHAYALTSEWTAQASWSHIRRDEFFGSEETNFDFDFQHRFQPWQQHDLVWGMSGRYRRDETDPFLFIRFDPLARSQLNASLFLQDEVRLLDDRFRIILGSRLEHDEHNKWELQPSIRGLWNISGRQKVWAAVSRAARTPSRADRDLVIELPLTLDLDGYGLTTLVPPGFAMNGNAPPIVIAVRGNKAFKTETLLSYELGYRLQPSPTTSVDLALFHNNYRHLYSFTVGGTRFANGVVVVDVPYTNTRSGTLFGGELVVSWAPSSDTQLELFWSEQRADFDDSSIVGYAVATAAEAAVPERQAGFRGEWRFGSAWSAGLQLKYRSALGPNFNFSPLTEGVSSYVDADASVTWQATSQLALSLLGRNLLDHSRLEYASETGIVPVEVRRAAYLRATWSF